MEAEVVTSEPAIPEPSGSVAVAAFQKAQSEADNSTPSPEPTAPATAAPATSASIVIPIDRVPEKFRANPDAVFGAYENAERQMHARGQEAAQLKRDNEALNARLAAAEQVNRMTPKPETPQENLSEMVITETPRFVETIEQRAARAGEAAARKVTQESEQKQTDRENAAQLIATFEAGKRIVREQGFTVSDDEWKQHIGNVANGVIAREPENALNPQRFAQLYTFYKGAPPKASIPAEGNPPVAARAATAQRADAPPTLTREEQQIKNQIWRALNLKKD